MNALKRLFAAALLLATLLVSTAGAAHGDEVARSAPGEIVPDRLLIGFRGALPADRSAFAAGLGGTVLGAIEPLNLLIVRVPAALAPQALATAAAYPDVAYAEHDAVVRALFTPNDAMYRDQWGPGAIKLPAAWDRTRGGHNRMIAVLDTGIDRTHDDLAGNYCHSGAAFLTFTGGGVEAATMDDNGHGTHVAGIAAAVINNTVGIAGTAQACLMAVKVLNAAGVGFTSDVAAGIAYAADNGAHVLNLSLGGTQGSDALRSAVGYAQGRGALVVAAAGNEGCPKSGDKSSVNYPGRYADLAVAALASATTVADYSSCGSEVDIAAPGSAIWSTFTGNTYLKLSGTSMATPFVSGVAALAWSCNPSLSAGAVRNALTRTADNIGSTARKVGAGRLDAEGAVLSAAC